MVGAVRFEPTAQRTDLPNKQSISASFTEANAQIASQSPAPLSPDLARIVKVWETLPKHIRKTIVLLSQTANPAP